MRIATDDPEPTEIFLEQNRKKSIVIWTLPIRWDCYSSHTPQLSVRPHPPPTQTWKCTSLARLGSQMKVWCRKLHTRHWISRRADSCPPNLDSIYTHTHTIKVKIKKRKAFRQPSILYKKTKVTPDTRQSQLGKVFPC